MSLNAAPSSTDDYHKFPLLRSSDQHDAWRVRVADKCWALTGKDILAVSDNVCLAALLKAHAEDAKADDIAVHGWVSKCWLTITSSIHDDILTKVAHVPRGQIETLLKEIAASLTVYNVEEVGPLRLELYGCTMQKCGSDLQAYISYIQQRQRKLTFLKRPVPDDELVNIFVNGLHPILQPLKIHLRIVDVNKMKWDEAVAVVRTHCAGPEVAAELTKLKSAGLSQHMFSMTNQVAPVTTQTSSRPQPCRNFARGRCTSGANCRFSHTAMPTSQSNPTRQSNNNNNNNNSNNTSGVRCAFCFNKGHVALECRKPTVATCRDPLCSKSSLGCR